MNIRVKDKIEKKSEFKHYFIVWAEQKAVAMDSSSAVAIVHCLGIILKEGNGKGLIDGLCLPRNI